MKDIKLSMWALVTQSVEVPYSDTVSTFQRAIKRLCGRHESGLRVI